VAIEAGTRTALSLTGEVLRAIAGPCSDCPTPLDSRLNAQLFDLQFAALLRVVGQLANKYAVSVGICSITDHSMLRSLEPVKRPSKRLAHRHHGTRSAGRHVNWLRAIRPRNLDLIGITRNGLRSWVSLRVTRIAGAGVDQMGCKERIRPIVSTRLSQRLKRESLEDNVAKWIAYDALGDPIVPGMGVDQLVRGDARQRTLLREAEQHVGSKYVDQVLDSLYVIECSMRHFYLRAEAAKNTNMKPEKIDGYYEKAAHLAALVAPYRHARLSAMKLAGDPKTRCESRMTRQSRSCAPNS
jgi:hypothetical protein